MKTVEIPQLGALGARNPLDRAKQMQSKYTAAALKRAAVYALQSHGVHVEVEAAKIETMKHAEAVQPAPYQVCRSRFVSG